MRVGLVGAGGRIGQAIAALLAADPADSAVPIGRDADPDATSAPIDVLVDFSVPAALAGTVALARRRHVPLLVGTTGLGAGELALLDAAAREIALLQTGNTSLGISLLARLVREAAARLGADWDIEIVEMHHRHKRDAPSGTALMLGAAAGQGRGTPARPVANPGEPRTPGTIGYASLRGGTVAGEHKVILAGDGERIELGHIAESRTLFARGAVAAARWLIGRGAGRYTMDDLFA